MVSKNRKMCGLFGSDEGRKESLGWRVDDCHFEFDRTAARRAVGLTRGCPGPMRAFRPRFFGLSGRRGDDRMLSDGFFLNPSLSC